ncbi:hypothetical protein [Halodesulfovibrio spirochaetisodalis]|uniref:Uncharacterized protein n=1 Tax=Halodesulfovibrio spirochaetisodalis TaxID=1560234 RepID=A0A1B7XDK3_9BACT|nr:hypothetical protein [Halodesulfovibrio spirochaetisodalis]OBQ52126.1 hypothetical protein SP90_08070 [Halodesulfovibrio spirochaetisodalis]
MSRLKIVLLIMVTFIFACNAYASDEEMYRPPTFSIEPCIIGEFPFFDRQVEVFGIPIFADPQVPDDKLLHAANVMAQYLDNNEDGKIDNPFVIEAMHESKAFLFMWSNEDIIKKTTTALEKSSVKLKAQDLGSNETKPEWHTSGHLGEFDAALEEIWHLITGAGYSIAYPEAFSEGSGSTLTKAMDRARGGHFTEIPSGYPASAWYTYDDTTCDYNCMAIEYIYWGMSSILGAQAKRAGEITAEWKLYKKTDVQKQDPTLFDLLTTEKYVFPKKLPDGNYRGFIHKK